MSQTPLKISAKRGRPQGKEAIRVRGAHAPRWNRFTGPFDELGAQKPTAWVQDILYLVINTRYTERRPTLFTTNYALERPRDPAPEPARPESLDRGADPPARHHRTPLLDERITAQLVSRLFEMARPVTLRGVDDHRKEIKASQARV